MLLLIALYWTFSRIIAARSSLLSRPLSALVASLYAYLGLLTFPSVLLRRSLTAAFLKAKLALVEMRIGRGKCSRSSKLTDMRESIFRLSCRSLSISSLKSYRIKSSFLLANSFSNLASSSSIDLKGNSARSCMPVVALLKFGGVRLRL